MTETSAPAARTLVTAYTSGREIDATAKTSTKTINELVDHRLANSRNAWRVINRTADRVTMRYATKIVVYTKIG